MSINAHHIKIPDHLTDPILRNLFQLKKLSVTNFLNRLDSSHQNVAMAIANWIEENEIQLTEKDVLPLIRLNDHLISSNFDYQATHKISGIIENLLGQPSNQAGMERIRALFPDQPRDQQAYIYKLLSPYFESPLMQFIDRIPPNGRSFSLVKKLTYLYSMVGNEIFEIFCSVLDLNRIDQQLKNPGIVCFSALSRVPSAQRATFIERISLFIKSKNLNSSENIINMLKTLSDIIQQIGEVPLKTILTIAEKAEYCFDPDSGLDLMSKIFTAHPVDQISQIIAKVSMAYAHLSFDFLNISSKHFQTNIWLRLLDKVIALIELPVDYDRKEMEDIMDILIDTDPEQREYLLDKLISFIGYSSGNPLAIEDKLAILAEIQRKEERLETLEQAIPLIPEAGEYRILLLGLDKVHQEQRSNLLAKVLPFIQQTSLNSKTIILIGILAKLSSEQKANFTQNDLQRIIKVIETIPQELLSSILKILPNRELIKKIICLNRVAWQVLASSNLWIVYIEWIAQSLRLKRKIEIEEIISYLLEISVSRSDCISLHECLFSELSSRLYTLKDCKRVCTVAHLVSLNLKSLYIHDRQQALALVAGDMLRITFNPSDPDSVYSLYSLALRGITDEKQAAEITRSIKIISKYGEMIPTVKFFIEDLVNAEQKQALLDAISEICMANLPLLEHITLSIKKMTNGYKRFYLLLIYFYFQSEFFAEFEQVIERIEDNNNLTSVRF